MSLAEPSWLLSGTIAMLEQHQGTSSGDQDQIHFISVCVLYLSYEYYSDVRTRYVHVLYDFAVLLQQGRDGW